MPKRNRPKSRKVSLSEQLAKDLLEYGEKTGFNLSLTQLAEKFAREGLQAALGVLK